MDNKFKSMLKSNTIRLNPLKQDHFMSRFGHYINMHNAISIVNLYKDRKVLNEALKAIPNHI